jgi:hypothetical protein
MTKGQRTDRTRSKRKKSKMREINPKMPNDDNKWTDKTVHLNPVDGFKKYLVTC